MQQGYKQTEVGVIPEDWQVSAMESLTSLMTNGFVGTIKSEYVPSGTGVLYLQGFNIKENGFDLTGVTYVSDAFHKKHLKSELKENDLLTVQTGDIGVTSYLPKQFEGANCQALIISRFYEKYDSRFWSYYFNSIGRKTLKLIETGTTMKHINVGDMKGVLVPVPISKTEQKRIADALCDVDSMIFSFEKLIAKKKANKQAVMQELLTGKRRLPGFTGEWKKYKLDDLLKYEQPTKYIVQNTEYFEQGIPVLTAGKSLLLGYTVEAEGIYENLPVIIFDDFVTSSKYIDFKFKVKSSAMKMLTLKNQNMNLKLIFELMQMIDFSPVDHQRHWISQYSQFEIKMPSETKEQEAIASILADMDCEIEALEQKFAKTRQVKQGMMQQLLTGKVRLV